MAKAEPTRDALEVLRRRIVSCDICAAHLPLGPRPVVRVSRSARLLIIGQAPGTKVHATGIPWDDASGDRLRDWLQVDKSVFYNESQIAIMPMGFCYPGRLERGGDAPPRPECAPAWHDALLSYMPGIALTLLVGAYAQKRYLGRAAGATLTETVRNHRRHLRNGFLPLPHPSWRTVSWQKKNPWFDEEILPVLREHAAGMLR